MDDLLEERAISSLHYIWNWPTPQGLRIKLVKGGGFGQNVLIRNLRTAQAVRGRKLCNLSHVVRNQRSWYSDVSGSTETFSLLLDDMIAVVARSRRLAAVRVLFLLAGVVMLSSATRVPSLPVSSGSWHIWKIGRMEMAGGQEVSKHNLAAKVRPRREFAAHYPDSLRAFVPQKETVRYSPSSIASVHLLRSPPFLG